MKTNVSKVTEGDIRALEGIGVDPHQATSLKGKHLIKVIFVFNGGILFEVVDSASISPRSI
ncbi:MAG: hypothetical protein R3F31_16085 [Verrucomicrobiales bacterium]